MISRKGRETYAKAVLKVYKTCGMIQTEIYFQREQRQKEKAQIPPMREIGQTPINLGGFDPKEAVRRH